MLKQGEVRAYTSEGEWERMIEVGYQGHCFRGYDGQRYYYVVMVRQELEVNEKWEIDDIWVDVVNGPDATSRLYGMVMYAAIVCDHEDMVRYMSYLMQEDRRFSGIHLSTHKVEELIIEIRGIIDNSWPHITERDKIILNDIQVRLLQYGTLAE